MSKRLGFDSKLLPISNNKIFIGVDYDGVPIVGRIISSKKKYMVEVRRIKEAVRLALFSNNAFVIMNRTTEISIVEDKECVSIGVSFYGEKMNAGFLGLSDTKGIGYLKFVEHYNRCKCVKILLKCAESNEDLYIVGFMNVKLQTL